MNLMIAYALLFIAALLSALAVVGGVVLVLEDLQASRTPPCVPGDGEHPLETTTRRLIRFSECQIAACVAFALVVTALHLLRR